MNPVFKAAAATVENGWIMGVTTIFFFAVFIGWITWAWAPWNRKNLDAAAKLPFDDGGEA